MADVICPFCNSRIEGRIDPARPHCPRCEAPLPASLVAQLATGITVLPHQPTVEQPFAPGPRKTVAAILGLMTVMATITVGYALWTKDFRRANDVKKGFVLAEPASQTPEELTALGFVPAKCAIVGAANLNDWRDNPLAKKLMTDQPPRSFDAIKERLKDATGLTFADLDQAAVGVALPDGFPRIYVIVQTRVPYDPQAIVKAFAPAKAQSLRNRPYVRFPLSPVGEGIVWCLDERQIAFLFRVEPGGVEELEQIPVRPRLRLEGSSETLRSLVKDRVDKQSLAWLAADMGPAAQLVDFLNLVNARPAQYKPFLDSKALTVSLKTDQDFVVLAQVLAKDAKAAEQLAESLNATDWRGEKSKKVETTPAEAKAEPWVTMQLRYDADGVRNLLSKGPAMKRE